MKKGKVIVTGGAGFIGSTVIRQLLSRGYEVTAFDNLSIGTIDNLPHDKNLRLIAGDVRDFEMVSAVLDDHDFVIHMAAQAFIPMSYDLPVKCADVNALGSLNVFKACLNGGKCKRIVHVSSSEVYGPATYMPMDEEHPLNPRSTYAVSKTAADLWAQTMAFEHNLPVVILRPFNAFGPRDSLPRFIPEVIRQCLKEPAVKVGDITTSRDFTYVEDLAQAIVLSLETENIEGEIINFGTGKSYKMSKILTMIKRMTENEEKEVIKDTLRLRPYDVDVLISSTNKAYKLLGFKPKVDFKDGLKKTIDWYTSSGKSWNYEKRGWNWRF